MRNPNRILLAASLTALLSGCMSMSGLDSSDNFSCKAAPGVTCQSISGVHQNASAGNLPFQRQGEKRSGEEEGTDKDDERPVYGASRGDGNAAGKVSPRDMNAAYSGMPVRQAPLVLRIWLAPYEDEVGDLHDQSYFYTMVHSGRWMIEANRNVISGQFMPVFPLSGIKGATQPSPEDDAKAMVHKGDYERMVGKSDMK